MTKSYAIDQIEDIERLRTAAHTMWEAFYACHSQFAHVLAALNGEGCDECSEAFGTGYTDEPCDEYDAWQAKISAGFGSV